MSEPELFKELAEPEKKKWRIFKRSKTLFSPAQRKFTISYDAMTLCCILFIVVLVVTFALGVDRGKLIGSQKPKLATQSSLKQEAIKPVLQPQLPPVPVPAPEAVKASVSVIENYTIQLVTYTSPEPARQICEKLRQKGYSPFVIVSGKYYQVCTGNYPARAEAEKDLAALKKNYKDSFVRKFKKNK